MKICIHIGAHKTATTFISRRLRQNREALSAIGIQSCTPEELRELTANVSPRRRLVRSTQKPALNMVLEKLVTDTRTAGSHRLAIQEENIIGVMNEFGRPGCFYNSAKDNLKSLAPFLQTHTPKLLLSIRDYGTFFASVYGYTLRKDAYFPFQAWRQNLLDLRRGWVDLVCDIRACVPPETELMLWEYEKFRDLDAEVMSAFVGSDALPALEHVPLKALKGPSQEAIDHLDALYRAGNVPDKAQIRQVMWDMPKGRGRRRFIPWTKEESTALTLRYREDVERLKESGIARFLKPGALH